MLMKIIQSTTLQIVAKITRPLVLLIALMCMLAANATTINVGDSFSVSQDGKSMFNCKILYYDDINHTGRVSIQLEVNRR